jgi:predicted CoA-binding protein
MSREETNAGTVAILGASRNRSKFGNKSLRAHRQAGYRVFPVNPRADEVEGIESYASLAEVPRPLDRISVYLPPTRTRSLLDQLAAAGAREVWFNPGSADDDLLRDAWAAGITVRDGCSIVDLGLSPSQFP